MKQVANQFTSYSLTEEEELAGYALTTNNVVVLRNELSRIAEQKLALKVDPLNIQEFIQTESYMAGQIAILNWLLEMAVSEAVVDLTVTKVDPATQQTEYQNTQQPSINSIFNTQP